MLLRRKEDVVTRNVAGEMLLVPIRGNLADLQKLFVIEGIGEHVWNSLDGSRTVDQICEEIVGIFDVGIEMARADVRRFISELQDAGLVTGD
ncbi:MAG: hypothetical protein C0404_01205 [Verrucomicrobia bacterium]|nr:hypothetical protein [Verrucomicrobiota bacterium]